MRAKEVEQDPKQIRKVDTRRVKSDSIVATRARTVATKTSLDRMQINIIHHKPQPLSLRAFKFFFQLLHSFLQLQSCFIK